MTHRLLNLIVVLAVTLAACASPTPSPTTVPSPSSTGDGRSPATPAPVVTPTSPPTQGTRPNVFDGIPRDPVAEADRANAQAIAAVELPLGDLREVAIRFKGLSPDTPELTCSTAPDYQVDDQHVFSVSNSQTYEQFEVTATLVAKEPNVYMWVDNNWLGIVDREVFVDAAQEFDRLVVPRNREVFGREWSPGIDCDPRLHVLNTSNTAAGGFFSSTDSYTRAVRPDSNEKEMFVVDLQGRGTPEFSAYRSTLAHEYQHMIHFHVDRNESVWVNEGLSMLAEFINGYGMEGLDSVFAAEPDTQLNFWPEGNDRRGNHYGAALVFMLYLYDRYGETAITRLVAEPRNSVEGVAAVLQAMGYRGTFDDFFADWLVAKFVDDPSLEDGRYGFAGADPATAQLANTITTFPYQPEAPATLNQYGAHYVMLIGDRDVRVDFAGSTRARMIGVDPHSGQYFWWSNRGDFANTALTREVDLTGVSRATLTYWAAFDIETDWDYAYVTVSTDGGQTYAVLRTPSGTDYDPNQNSVGWGYTGDSGGGPMPVWIQESVDLTPYAGQRILLGFQIVNDLGVNLPGFAVDDIEIPEIGFKDDAETDTGWTTEGWVRTSNFVPQNFIAQVIGYGQDGQTTVTRLPIDADNTGTWDIPLSRWNSAVLVLAATALKSSEPAWFNWVMTER